MLEVHPDLRGLRVAWRWPNGIAFRGRAGRITNVAIASGRLHVPEARGWRPVDVQPFRSGGRIVVRDLPFGIGSAGEIRQPRKAAYLPRSVGVITNGVYRRLYRIGAPLLTPTTIYRPISRGMHFETQIGTEGVSEHLMLDEHPQVDGDYLAIEVGVKDVRGCMTWLAWAEDRVGRRIVCDLLKQPNSVLVAVPVAWLDKATFPVDIDPDLTTGLICWCQGTDAGTYAAARATCTSALASCGGDQRLGQLFWAPTNYSVARHSWVFPAVCLSGTVTDVTMDLAAGSKAETLTDFDVEIADSDFNSNYPPSLAHSTKCGFGCTHCEGIWDTCVGAGTSVTWKNTAAVMIDTIYTSPSLAAAYAETCLQDYGALYYCALSAEDQAASAPTGYEAIDIYCPGNATYKPVVHLTGDFADCSGMQAYIIPEV